MAAVLAEPPFSKVSPTVHILARTLQAANGFARDLALCGFNAFGGKVNEPARPVSIKKNDAVVVAGDTMTGDVIEYLSQPEIRRNCERTIIFAEDIRPQQFSTLSRLGYNYINASLANIEKFLYLIAKIDPAWHAESVRRTESRRTAARQLEAGVEAQFDLARSDKAELTLASSKLQQAGLDDMLQATPMGLWLELVQNYHDATAQHCSLVSGIALKFARHLGCGPAVSSRIHDAAFFHDIGKSHVPLEILDKPKALTQAEWKIMRRHTLAGYDILCRSEQTGGEIARIARDHHEYLDGTGYPYGISGKAIDDMTRILTICDIYAAFLERRAYKEPKPPDVAYGILQSMAGSKLDPDLVREFEKVAAECAEFTLT